MNTTMAVPKQGDNPQNGQSRLSYIPDSVKKPLVKTKEPMDIIKRLHMKPDSVSREELIILQRVMGMRGISKLLDTLKNQKRNQEEKKTVQKKEGKIKEKGIYGENKSNLPDKLKAGLETLSNHDLSDVNVHYNSDRPSQVGAFAYTKGSNIYIAPGQEKHLPHEGWHAVQQKQGRVEPTFRMEKGIQVNNDSDLEKEADIMGEKAATITDSISPEKRKVLRKESKEEVVQRFSIFGWKPNLGDILEGGQVALELTAAIASGGGSILLQIGMWLARTLPGIIKKATAITGFINSIHSIKLENIKEYLAPSGIGEFLVKGLFGELKGIKEEDKDDNDDIGDKEKDHEGGKEGKGLMKVLGILTSIFKVLKKIYGKVSGAINKILPIINISNKPWFGPFSMIYAGTVKALELVQNPGEMLNDGAEKIKEAVSEFFQSIRSKIKDVASSIKKKLTLIVQPAHIMKFLANKALDMVLNFIITNPPSALIKALFKVIESASGQSIVELVRKHVPFADKILDKIAESAPVKGLLHPLEQPVKRGMGIVEEVTGKASGMVNEVEQKAASAFTSGNKLLKALSEGSGGKGSPGQGKKGGDFLAKIKNGIHERLMVFGQKLLSKGKSVVKTGINKLKPGVNKIKGIILGRKAKFKIDKENHELWLEKQGKKNVLMMASVEGKPVEEQINLDSPKVKNVNLEQLIKETEKTGNEHNVPRIAKIISSTCSEGANEAEYKEYDIVSYKQVVNPPGQKIFEKHHGILNKWAEENIKNYKRDDAPTLVLSISNHNNTRGIYNKWRSTITGGKKGASIEWKRMAPNEVKKLSEESFDAAKVPLGKRAEFYREFNKYIYSLS